MKSRQGAIILRPALPGRNTGILTVPSALGVSHLFGREFEVRLTDEGILFTLAEPENPPGWAKP